MTGTATLTLAASQFTAADRRVLQVQAGQTVGAILAEHAPSVAATSHEAVLDGTSVEWGARVDPGAILAVAPKLEGEVAVGILEFLGSAAVSTGLAYAAQYAQRRQLGRDGDALEQGRGAGSQHYRWDGARTEYLPDGAPRPVIYGERMTGGSCIAYAVRAQQGESVIRELLAISEGPIESIAGIAGELDDATVAQLSPDAARIDGNALSGFGSRARISTRLGTLDQRAVEGLNDQERQFTVNIELHRQGQNLQGAGGAANVYLYQTRGSATSLRFLIGFPRGNAGQGTKVGFRYRVRQRGGAWGAYATAVIQKKLSYGGEAEFEVQLGQSGLYDVEVNRFHPNPAGKYSPFATTQLVAVTEVTARDFRYPGISYAYLELDEVEGLTAGYANILLLVRGVQVPIWDGVSTTNPNYERAWTRNPFWIVLDLLRDTVYGLGYALRHMQIDLQDWKDAADHADELVYADLETTLTTATASGVSILPVVNTQAWNRGDQVWINKGEADQEQVEVAEVLASHLRLQVVTTAAHAAGATVQKYHARYELDVVLDVTTSPWEQIQELLHTARAKVVKIGNRIKLIRAIAQDPVALISEGNGADLVERYRGLRAQPNRLLATFWNRNKLYERDSLPVNAEDAVLDQASSSTYFQREAFVEKPITLKSITRVEQVRRHLTWELRVIRLAKRAFSSTVPLGPGVVIEVGDRVEVAHRIAQDGVSGLVGAGVSSGTSTITLDRQVVLQAATTYAIQVVVGNDAVATRTITSAAGTYAAGDSLSISPATWPEAVADDAPYAVGVEGEETVSCIVVDHQLREDLRVELELEEYVEAALADA